MVLEERLKRYKLIEEKRQRPLIVYATSTRQNVPSQMAGDAVREFIDQINAIKDGNEVDVLIHSTGGDPLAAWKLMSVLRERFERVSVLVPYMAFSAATLFALGADEIVMHAHASLGPIDPQITIVLPDGTPRHFSFEDVGAFLRFLEEEVGITEQVHLSTIMDKLFSAVDALNLGGAKRASELATSVGERLLLMHMDSVDERPRAREIAENLNKSFFAHGDAVSRTRASELQLKVAASDVELDTLIWNAYLAIESYLQLRIPFHPLQHFLASPEGAAAAKPTGPLQIPPNTPPQIVENLWQHLAQQAIAKATGSGVEVPYSLVNAIVESARVASECRTAGKLVLSRIVGGEIQLSAIDTDAGWCPVELPG